MSLLFTPEDAITTIPIEVNIVRAFTPFTTAQTLLVQPLRPYTFLPPHFVLKLSDPRFSEDNDMSRLFKGGWTKNSDMAFRRGLRRVRSGEWGNHWRLLGASVDSRLPDADFDDDDQINWIFEMHRWSGLRGAHDTELVALRKLRFLQGSKIPHLYGNCVYVGDDAAPDMDPIISHVPGLLLEYINGTPLDKFVVGDNLSKEESERISQGCLATLRIIRDNLLVHNDFAPRNVIIRPYDFDHPVIIDFGSALLREDYPKMSDDQWITIVTENQEVLDARKQLGRLGYHNPSPIPEYFDMISRNMYCQGHASFNNIVETMRPDWRDEYYERVEDVPPPVNKVTEDGEEYTWYYPRWRIKPGVSTANASADYMWRSPRSPPARKFCTALFSEARKQSSLSQDHAER